MPKRDNPRTGPKYEKPERPAAKRRTAARGAAPAAKGRPAAQGRTPVRAEENPNLLIGRNPISEAIKATPPRRLLWNIGEVSPLTQSLNVIIVKVGKPSFTKPHKIKSTPRSHCQARIGGKGASPR